MTGTKLHRIKLLAIQATGKTIYRVSKIGFGGSVLLVLLSCSAFGGDLKSGLVLSGAHLGDEPDVAITGNPHSAKTKIDMGLALVRTGDLKKAEQLLREALQNNPDPVQAHYGLGLIYGKQGDFARATDEFKEGIRKHRQGRR